MYIAYMWLSEHNSIIIIIMIMYQDLNLLLYLEWTHAGI